MAGERLEAGTIERKEQTSCRTCGASDQRLTSGGHCFNVAECAARRDVIAERRRPVKKPPPAKPKFLVELRYYGSVYYVRTFRSASTDPKVTIKEQALQFDAVLERSEAESFTLEEAEAFARQFNGKVVPK